MTEDSPVKYKRDKGGRPRLPEHEKKTNRVEVWLADNELADLENLTKDTALSRADVIRLLIAKRPIRRTTTPKINVETYAELGRIGTNVNQLAKLANQHGYGEGFKQMNDLYHVINKLRSELLGGGDDS